MGLQRVRHDWATFTFTLSSNIMSDFYFFSFNFSIFSQKHIWIFNLSSFFLSAFYVTCLFDQKMLLGRGWGVRGGGKRESKCTSLTGIICLVTKLCPPLLQPHGLQPTRLLCPWNFPGKNTGVGCHVLLWEIFLTLGPNPHLLHWQADFLYHRATEMVVLLVHTAIRSITRWENQLSIIQINEG